MKSQTVSKKTQKHPIYGEIDTSEPLVKASNAPSNESWKLPNNPNTAPFAAASGTDSDAAKPAMDETMPNTSNTPSLENGSPMDTSHSLEKVPRSPLYSEVYPNQSVESFRHYINLSCASIENNDEQNESNETATKPNDGTQEVSRDGTQEVSCDDGTQEVSRDDGTKLKADSQMSVEEPEDQTVESFKHQEADCNPVGDMQRVSSGSVSSQMSVEAGRFGEDEFPKCESGESIDHGGYEDQLVEDFDSSSAPAANEMLADEVAEQLSESQTSADAVNVDKATSAVNKDNNMSDQEFP